MKNSDKRKNAKKKNCRTRTQIITTIAMILEEYQKSVQSEWLANPTLSAFQSLYMNCEQI
jgi:hypothetical protein